jgi:hypothetical protein
MIVKKKNSRMKLKKKKKTKLKKKKKRRKLQNDSQVLSTEVEGITIKILFSQGYTILRRMGQ